MLEAKAEYVAAHGLSRTDWFLSRAQSFGRLGCAVTPFSNLMLSTKLSRWFIEKLFGIARARKLPQFARQTLLKSLRRRTAKSDRGRPVVYFVDHFANYHDTELGQAFLRILDHFGQPWIVPEGQDGSGMAMISAGDLEAAREVAEHNIRELAEYARDGYRIVCTEPAAALCLKEEYPRILDHPDVSIVAAQAMDAGSYLLSLHEQGVLRTNFAPIDLTAGVHTPCHAKALGYAPYTELLKLIPGLTLVDINLGCSGMAGAYGLTATHFEQSLEIGRPLIERMQQPDLNIGLTECSSCRLQMEQGTSTPTLHPIKLLALAYGLMPEIRKRLKPNTRRLTVS